MNTADRRQLGAILAYRNSPQKHVWRARIVLLTADGVGTAEIMRTAGVSKTAVWRWQGPPILTKSSSLSGEGTK